MAKGEIVINKMCLYCVACNRPIAPHKVKVPNAEHGELMWEDMCSHCRAHVPRWNVNTEQWNNDGYSVRLGSDEGDSLDVLFGAMRNGGNQGNGFN